MILWACLWTLVISHFTAYALHISIAFCHQEKPKIPLFLPWFIKQVGTLRNNNIVKHLIVHYGLTICPKKACQTPLLVGTMLEVKININLRTISTSFPTIIGCWPRSFRTRKLYRFFFKKRTFSALLLVCTITCMISALFTCN